MGINDCNYECYKCDDIVTCDHCDGPWCSICDGSWYKYYATANSLCGEGVILESQLNTGDCPIAGDDLLDIGRNYDCFVAMENDQCKYNGNSVFVFSDNDLNISIGKKYVDLGYGGLG